MLASGQGARRRLSAALKLAAAVTLALIARLRRGRRGAVITYHRIARDQVRPGRLLPTVHEADLERQLRLLSRWYRVVALHELPAAAAERRRGDRLPVAIALDDDLADHLRVAAPALEQAGLPATFFLTGAGLGDPLPFWWESLQALADRGDDPATALEGVIAVAPGSPVDAIAERIKQSDPATRRTAAARLAGAAAEVPPPMSAPAVRDLASRFSIGFHTRDHDYLPSLDDASLDAALRTGRAELEAAIGRPVDMIAYPHGGVDERTAPAARTAGFRIGVTTDPRGIGGDPLLIGRVEPRSADLPGFWLELELALHRSPA